MEKKTTKAKINDRFDAVMDDAMEMFRRIQFRQTIPNIILEEFSNKLAEAVEIDEDRVEPYVFLSYVFFQMKQNKLGFEYLKKAHSIDPTFSDIENLKQAVLKHRLTEKENVVEKVKMFE